MRRIVNAPGQSDEDTRGNPFDLGLALVRGEVRLGFLLYRSWGENMEGFKKTREKRPFKYPFTHGGTGTSKSGTGTKSVLPIFS